MKKNYKLFYKCDQETGEITYEYYVMGTQDAKVTYKAIVRAWNKENTLLSPLFCDFPVLNPAKEIYAICVDCAGYVTIVNSDTMLSMIVNNVVSEC